MHGSERERGGAAARIADKMETLEAASVSNPQNPPYLSSKTVVRRRLIPGVYLKILPNRIDTLAEHLKQRRIRRSGRQNRTRQQHDRIASRHSVDPTPRRHPTQPTPRAGRLVNP